jgi:hypothetical protein
LQGGSVIVLDACMLIADLGTQMPQCGLRGLGLALPEPAAGALLAVSAANVASGPNGRR